MSKVKSLILILAAFFLALIFLIILVVKFSSFSTDKQNRLIEEESILIPTTPAINFEENNDVQEISYPNPGQIIDNNDFSYLNLPSSLEEFTVNNFNINEIIYLLNTYFIVNNSNALVVSNLEDFFNNKEGSTLDFAFFITQALKVNNLEAGVLRYDYNTNQTGFVVIFRDQELPKYAVATNEGVLLFHHGWSFSDLITMEESRLGVEIERYAYFPPNTIDFTEPVFDYEWIYLNK